MPSEFDDLPSANGTTAGSSGPAPIDEFSSTPQATPPSYLGAAFQSGIHSTAAAVGTVANLAGTALGLTTPQEDLAYLHRNDPNATENLKNLPGNILQTATDYQQQQAADAMKNLGPEGEALQSKEYATLDPSKSAFLSPKRILGDVMQNAPQAIALAGTAVFTRGAGLKAYEDAMAAGAGDVAARAAAIRASANAASVAGGVAEGQIGFAQQANQAKQDVMTMAPQDLIKLPGYVALLQQGFQPQAAQQMLAAQHAAESGIAGGLTDMAVSAAGGSVLGKIIGEGGTLIPRVARGFATEGIVEGVQGVGEQAGQNISEQQVLGKDTPTFQGAGEQALSGAVVGGLMGGAMTGIAGREHQHAEQAKALADSANVATIEAETGMAPAGHVTTKAFTPAPTPRALTPIQQQISDAATAAGIDPKTALTIASIETGGTFNPTLKNKTSSATGLFQMLDSTWASEGGTAADRLDPQAQIARGMGWLSGLQDTMAKQLGRQPTPGEMYLGHLLGPQGANALLKANPSTPIAAVISSYDPKNASAIIANNGMTGMTAEQARQKWGQVVSDHGTRMGMVPEATTSADAGTNTTALDDGIFNEIDAMLAQQDSAPLTADEEAAAQREHQTRTNGDLNADPDEAAMQSALDAVQKAPASPSTAQAPPAQLPPDLSAAQPRYGMGKTIAPLNFESDVDKAAYIIANQTTKSARHDDYMNFVMQNTGMTSAEAIAYGQQVRQASREAVQSGIRAGVVQTGSAITIPSQQEASTARGVNEAFVSRDEQATRDKYSNPNDKTTLGATPILAATSPEAVGETLRNAIPAPGEVVAASHETNVAPPAYVKAVQQTLEGWVKKFMPDARMVASFRTDKRSTAFYEHRAHYFGRNLYQINARPLYNFGLKDGSSTNQTTQIKAAVSLAHEFGHALMDHEFIRGLNPDQARMVLNLPAGEVFTESQLASLPGPQQAVMREYNQLKSDTLNSRLTKTEWAQKWLSPWKLAHGWSTAQGIDSFGRKFLGENWSNLTTAQFAMQLNDHSDILSPHEYMAEQFAKYAYSSKLLQNSPLGVQEFFASAFDRLKRFFKGLKAEKAIAPGTEFKAWVEGLTGVAEIQKQAAEAPAQAPTAQVSRAAPTTAPKPRVRKVATVAPVVEAPPMLIEPPALNFEQATQENTNVAPPEVLQAARKLLFGELRDLQMVDPALYGELRELLKAGHLDEFAYQVEQYVGPEAANKMRFDMSDPAQEPYGTLTHDFEKHFGQSTSLKTWFGNGMKSLMNAKYYTMTMRQAAYKMFDVAGIQHINDMMTAYKAMKSKLEVKATQTTADWAKLPKEQAGRMEALMRQEFHSGEHLTQIQNVNGAPRHVVTPEFATAAKKAGITEKTGQVYLDAKNAYLQHINVLHNLLRQKAQARLAANPALLRKQLQTLATTFDQIRARPFIAQTRFGSYAVQVRDKETKEVKHLEYFESPDQRDAAVKALKKVTTPGDEVIPATYSPTSTILRTLPPQLVTQYAAEMQLTPLQRADVMTQVDLAARNPQVRKYSAALAQITGAHKDMLRAFADFMWHDSTNIAKMRYREEFNKGLKMITDQMTEAKDDADFKRTDELKQTLNFATKYVSHILWPADEWQKARSMVVVNQLWGNIKTAVANLNSLANIWAIASTRQGLVKGSGVFGKTALNMMSEAVNETMRLGRTPAENYKNLKPDERMAMQQAQSSGLLDETFAAQLAGYANVGVLNRLNMSRVDKAISMVSRVGMQPQHLVENFTRRVTFLTSYRGYSAQGLDQNAAFKAAMRDTQLSQGDNSLGNRPAFMRGKASLFTIYYGYMQNMLWLMGGGYESARRARVAAGAEVAAPGGKFASETVKMWAAYALLGGLMGLPGAEDADRILELVSKKLFGERFSLHEHAMSLAKGISDNASQLGLSIEPRSIVHGSLSDFGLFGLTPRVDMSGSMSLGSAIPGMENVDKLDSKNGAFDFLVGMMGPFGAEVKQFTNLMQDDPTGMKKYGLLPGAAQNLAKGWLNWEKGALYPSGGRITKDLDTGEVRDITTGEKVAQLMGFQPSVITANTEEHYMKADAQDYWVTRRNNMIAQYYEAVKSNDREAMADVREAIQAYNEKAPVPVKIRGDALNASIQDRRKQGRADEFGRPVQPQWGSVYNPIAESFRQGGQ